VLELALLLKELGWDSVVAAKMDPMDWDNAADIAGVNHPQEETRRMVIEAMARAERICQ